MNFLTDSEDYNNKPKKKIHDPEADNTLKFYSLKPPHYNGFEIRNLYKDLTYILWFLPNQILLKTVKYKTIATVELPRGMEDTENGITITTINEQIEQRFLLKQIKNSYWKLITYEDPFHQGEYSINLSESNFYVKKGRDEGKVILHFFRKMFQTKEGILRIREKLEFSELAGLILSIGLLIYCQKCFKAYVITRQEIEMNENIQAKHLAFMGSVDGVNAYQKNVIFDSYADLHSLETNILIKSKSQSVFF